MKLILSIVASLCVLITSAAELTAKVIKVYDGDTIKVEDKDGGKFKVRLADIDAPELSQPYGQTAKKVLSDLVLNKTVSIRFTQIDMYGRIVGTVYLTEPEAESVNRMLVRGGHAWWYRAYSEDTEFEDIEIKAQKDKKGLWSKEPQSPPWTYRRSRRKV